MWNLINYNNGNEADSKFTFWNIFGYEEKQISDEINDEINKKKEDNYLKVEGTQKNELDETIGDSISSKKDKKKKKKKLEKIKENRNKSPFLSDMSSYADYCTSDGGKENYKLNLENETMLSNDDNDKSYLASSTEELSEKEMNVNELEVDVNEKVEKNVDENDNFKRDCNEENENIISSTNEWFFEKIKGILDPSLNQESISELITNKYNSFNEANAGIFDLLENLLLRSGTQEKIELEKRQKSYFFYDHYNSMDESYNDHYNFINYSIYCINKELSATVELEATKMMKIYNNAFNSFKKEIKYNDAVYTDLLNEGEEFSTLIIDENNKVKKRISKIDFLILININSDNYNNIIESHNIQTPKLNLEDIFKINVN